MGFVGDVEIDTENAKLTTIIIYGRSRLFGLLGRTDDIMIPWENIDVIGDETILVNHTIYASPQRRKQSLWSQFFGGHPMAEKYKIYLQFYICHAIIIRFNITHVTV